MNKRERARLIEKANKEFGRPFVIEANNEAHTRFGLIQTDADERMFINFASSQQSWYARDLSKK